MNLIKYSKILLAFTVCLTVAMCAPFVIYGLRYGIDFTGGSLMEIAYQNYRPSAEDMQQQLQPLGLQSFNVQVIDEQNAIFRFKDVDEAKHQEILQILASTASPVATSTASAATSPIEELRFESVGPSFGEELKRRAVYAIIIILFVIVAYIAWVFRKVSKPVASWKYGIATLFALFHDIMLVVGIFSLLGHFAGVEVNTWFVAALLTILGYSVNDTIVVVDRVRENLPRSDKDYIGTVDDSINQTLARSINTTLTTLLALVALLLFGGETIFYFMLALTIGIASGAYSSIFIAAPILVEWEKWQRRKAA